mgnify:CR=1 FL=1
MIATQTYEISFIDRLGYYPAILAIIACALGLLAIIKRKPAIDALAASSLAAVGCAAFGATAWRLYRDSALFLPGSYPDPAQWLGSFADAWLPLGVVMPVVAFGLVLVGVSRFVTASRGREAAEMPNKSE